MNLIVKLPKAVREPHYVEENGRRETNYGFVEKGDVYIGTDHIIAITAHRYDAGYSLIECIGGAESYDFVISLSASAVQQIIRDAQNDWAYTMHSPNV